MKPETAETIKLILGLITLILSISSIVISVRASARTKRRASYTNFDTYYNSLLKEALQYPDFRDHAFTIKYEPLDEHSDIPKKEEESKKIKQYEIYAFMCWNFCETVFDCCIREKDADLKDTWGCIIEAENKLHRKWFFSNENYKNFKPGFQKYVEQMAITYQVK